MKKLFSIFIILILMLTVFGCYQKPADDAVLQAEEFEIKTQNELTVTDAPKENDAVINSAFEMYDGLIYLNWKGEIESLIDGGIDKWVMCVDDHYQHSTVYAGYVGAHMIYRKVFGKIPPKLANAPLTQSQIDGNLGEYAYSLHTPEAPKEIKFDGVEYKI